MRSGTESPVSGFMVVSAIPAKHGNPGHFEVSYRIDAGYEVRFTGSTEKAVLDKAASWLGEQAKRKDGGALRKHLPPVPKSKPKPKDPDVVEA